MWGLIVNFIKSNLIAVIAAGISLTSATISLTSLRFSIKSWGKTRTSTLYSDIDGRYMELLKLGIANPEFVDPVYTSDYKTKFKESDLLKYERYAFAAWNIVETIIDRRTEDDLEKTWDPVIREENWLHRRWLNDRDNQHKFKKEFWRFMIENKKAFPCPDCSDNVPCPRCAEIERMAYSDQEIPINATVNAGIGPIGS